MQFLTRFVKISNEMGCVRLRNAARLFFTDGGGGETTSRRNCVMMQADAQERRARRRGLPVNSGGLIRASEERPCPRRRARRVGASKNRETGEAPENIRVPGGGQGRKFFSAEREDIQL